VRADWVWGGGSGRDFWGIFFYLSLLVNFLDGAKGGVGGDLGLLLVWVALR
jgi:hypothetical protein